MSCRNFLLDRFTGNEFGILNLVKVKDLLYVARYSQRYSV